MQGTVRCGVVWAGVVWATVAAAQDPAAVVSVDDAIGAAPLPGLSTAARGFDPGSRRDEKALHASIGGAATPETPAALRELAAMCWAGGTDDLRDAKKLGGWGKLSATVVSTAALAGGVAAGLDLFVKDESKQKPSQVVVPISAIATTLFGGVGAMVHKRRGNQQELGAARLIAAEEAYSWSMEHPDPAPADVRARGIDLRLACTGAR